MNYNYNKNRGRFKPRQQRFDRPKRPGLPEGFSLFYIAIECPADINQQIEQLKDYMEKNHGCKAAKKSPAHLTIVPPFRAEDEMVNELVDFVTTFNVGMVPVDIKLKNYGQFAERVLYVDIEGPNESLLDLEKECMGEFTEKFPGIIFGMKPDFNPHVTIATRDIPEGKLAPSRAYFEEHFPMDVPFSAQALSLYRLENGWWNKVV
ncbi:MAG: 2'-5' RNA ligase family protein [Chitinophagaceae bacterium]|jgi:2'-5' RNA ligase|nr:2'-5' RNA ligase family protein [Chitinophagaceae bacterium]